MTFSFKVRQPPCDLSFLSVIDAETLFTSDERTFGDLKEATIQQMACHMVALPQEWFLSEHAISQTQRVLKVMQCTIQYLCYCKQQVEKQRDRLAENLEMAHKDRHAALSSIRRLPEGKTRIDARVMNGESRTCPKPSVVRAPCSSGPPFICPFCWNAYPSHRSFSSHLRKRHQRTMTDVGGFAATAATMAPTPFGGARLDEQNWYNEVMEGINQVRCAVEMLVNKNPTSSFATHPCGVLPGLPLPVSPDIGATGTTDEVKCLRQALVDVTKCVRDIGQTLTGAVPPVINERSSPLHPGDCNATPCADARTRRLGISSDDGPTSSATPPNFTDFPSASLIAHDKEQILRHRSNLKVHNISTTGSHEGFSLPVQSPSSKSDSVARAISDMNLGTLLAPSSAFTGSLYNSENRVVKSSPYAQVTSSGTLQSYPLTSVGNTPEVPPLPISSILSRGQPTYSDSSPSSLLSNELRSRGSSAPNGRDDIVKTSRGERLPIVLQTNRSPATSRTGADTLSPVLGLPHANDVGHGEHGGNEAMAGSTMSGSLWDMLAGSTFSAYDRGTCHNGATRSATALPDSTEERDVGYTYDYFTSASASSQAAERMEPPHYSPLGSCTNTCFSDPCVLPPQEVESSQSESIAIDEDDQRSFPTAVAVDNHCGSSGGHRSSLFEGLSVADADRAEASASGASPMSQQGSSTRVLASFNAGSVGCTPTAVPHLFPTSLSGAGSGNRDDSSGKGRSPASATNRNGNSYSFSSSTSVVTKTDGSTHFSTMPTCSHRRGRNRHRQDPSSGTDSGFPTVPNLHSPQQVGKAGARVALGQGTSLVSPEGWKHSPQESEVAAHGHSSETKKKKGGGFLRKLFGKSRSAPQHAS